ERKMPYYGTLVLFLVFGIFTPSTLADFNRKALPLHHFKPPLEQNYESSEAPHIPQSTLTKHPMPIPIDIPPSPGTPYSPIRPPP
ncbi:hypothetical protein VIGAN_08303100, partial [Vigna angularis var. angularis]